MKACFFAFQAVVFPCSGLFVLTLGFLLPCLLILLLLCRSKQRHDEQHNQSLLVSRCLIFLLLKLLMDEFFDGRLPSVYTSQCCSAVSLIKKLTESRRDIQTAARIFIPSAYKLPLLIVH